MVLRKVKTPESRWQDCPEDRWQADNMSNSVVESLKRLGAHKLKELHIHFENRGGSQQEPTARFSDFQAGSRLFDVDSVPR